MFGKKKNKKAEGVSTETATKVEGASINIDNDSVTPIEDGTAIDYEPKGKDNEVVEVHGEPPEQQEEEVPPLTYREVKHLKRAKYDKIAGKFKKAFVLRNKKTGQIVEIRAASSFHACNIIGWKPNRVKVMEVKTIEEKDPVVGETSTIEKKNDGETKE